ncbi:signal recognition particle-docking protein FtsY [Natranaerofaba carboxydovora]|uniref:signal recognition particle-docking protein FtsY n=1 Tax=Natranaerofaba carboxydovora TaxID=2742683 RepID=UPI001F12D8FA|nr:signal recognition particle-docking protein FtsY [Natranaerofaba carboxydovora]UMZ73331.1 Signal recognition particle receptor FtsY [Natranaerofaba carboxydovora]
MGIFSKIKDGLTKTRQGFSGKMENLFSGLKKIDEETYEELEEILISADIGVDVSIKVVDELRQEVKENKVKDPEEVYGLLKNKLVEVMGSTPEPLNKDTSDLTVIMVVGVNGGGKTTTVGKLAKNLKDNGDRVLLAAADTFRAAAIEQLSAWGDRIGVDVIKHQESADPAAVVYDAIAAAKARNADYLICDTAGRLHTKKNLMQELSKIRRVISREIPDAPQEVLLVLDATTGQNAIKQAEVFLEATSVTGIVLTKLDGTAKGGVVIATREELGIPVKYIGVGEREDDLQNFDPEEFVEALFETS